MAAALQETLALAVLVDQAAEVAMAQMLVVLVTRPVHLLFKVTREGLAKQGRNSVAAAEEAEVLLVLIQLDQEQHLVVQAVLAEQVL